VWLITQLVAPLVVDTSTTLRVRVPQHVTRLVMWLVVDYSTSHRLIIDYFAYAVRLALALLVARLVVDYFASRRLVVDYFAYAARPGASAPRAARRVARLTASSTTPCVARNYLSRGTIHLD
jgi:hypothetical protein